MHLLSEYPDIMKVWPVAENCIINLLSLRTLGVTAKISNGQQWPTQGKVVYKMFSKLKLTEVQVNKLNEMAPFWINWNYKPGSKNH